MQVYQNFFESLLNSVDRKVFDSDDSLRDIRNTLIPTLLPHHPKHPEQCVNVIYDRQMHIDFKSWVISRRQRFLEKPWLFHSLLTEMKSMFLPTEYKDLRNFLSNDFKLVLDETSEKMGRLKFAESDSSDSTKAEEIQELIGILANKEEKIGEKLLKKYMNVKGFVIADKKETHKAFYSESGYTLEGHISDQFQYYFENLKKFQSLKLEDDVRRSIEFLAKRDLISEKNKDRFLKNKIKYEKEFKALEKKIQLGGKIIAEEFKNQALKISKADKEATHEKFKRLAETINGFDFAKHGLTGELSFIYFGSFKSGFALKASDIDTTILTNSAFNERHLLAPLLEYLTELKSHSAIKFDLEDRVKETIRIPIIKYHDITDFKADIAVNNILGVANSSLLKVYSKIDKRCKQLGLLLKHWAKKWRITNEDSMSSYALILLMIYFLQLKKILPSVQKIAKCNKNHEPALVKVKRVVKDTKVEEFETDLSYERDQEKIRKYMKENDYFDENGKSKNKQNLLELLLEFFYFYTDKGAFRKYRMKVNIVTGEVCFKNTLTEKYQRLERHYMFSIKDPFDKMHNPGDRVKKIEKTKEITYFMDTTIQELETDDYMNNRYQRFFCGNA